MAASPTPSLESLPGAANSIESFGEPNDYLSDSPLTLSGSSPPVSDSAICDDFSSSGLDSQNGSLTGSTGSTNGTSGPRCTGCKSKQSDAVAKCIECANYLCANCVTAHQFMHCFEGHLVLQINELKASGHGIPSGPTIQPPPLSNQQLSQTHLNKIMNGFESHRLALNMKDDTFKYSDIISPPSSNINSSSALTNSSSILHQLDNSSLLAIQQTAAATAASFKASLNSYFCTRHKAELLKFYCRTCSLTVCRECIVADHPASSHECEHVGDATPKQIENLLQIVQEVRGKAVDMRSIIKNAENNAARVQVQYTKAQTEITETYHFYQSMLDERKQELLKELENFYSAKNMSQSVLLTKSQDHVDKVLQSCDFVERLTKHAGLTETITLRKLMENKLQSFLSFIQELQSTFELDFVSNYQAIQVGVRNTFGYIRSSPDMPAKQPPIARPTSNSNMMIQQQQQSNGMMNNGCSTNGSSPNSSNGSSMNMQQQHQQQQQQQHQQQQSQLTMASMNQLNQTLSSTVSSLSAPPSSIGSGMLERPYSSALSSMSAQIHQSLAAASFDTNNSSNSIINKRFNGANSLGPFVSNDCNNLQINPYEKWSNGGSDSIFNNIPDNFSGSNCSTLLMSAQQQQQQQQQQSHQQQSHQQSHQQHQQQQQQQTHHSSNISSNQSGLCSTSDAISSLSAKLISTPIFPPKSQIKRHKMIYHCKFGEFGVMEGQFTEPSGVAVNAQNDIIVADTNNHRIQIFDKEGRFKFQFGECGKRDGQLLYPNRVAVVRNSGDIIVTERSPTHQIQIYNQYGQFVRKFGANILQHPRGVTVDNKGRVIVVECKVMRVIIFDQTGNVLQKFGCSKHLEFPNGVVVNDKQEIFISDNRAHCVKVFSYEGVYLRQIGGEGVTNYPIGVGINATGEILIADNHNNFNLTIFTQDGQLVSALESKVKHAQCFDVALMDDGSVVLASKDYRLYIYRYVQVPTIGL